MNVCEECGIEADNGIDVAPMEDSILCADCVSDLVGEPVALSRIRIGAGGPVVRVWLPVA